MAARMSTVDAPLAVVRARRHKRDRVFAALDVVRRLPQLAGHLEHMVWNDHGKRSPLLDVSTLHALATDFERRVQNVNDELIPFLLALPTERHPALSLNQAELEYDVGA